MTIHPDVIVLTYRWPITCMHSNLTVILSHNLHRHKKIFVLVIILTIVIFFQIKLWIKTFLLGQTITLSPFEEVK